MYAYNEAELAAALAIPNVVVGLRSHIVPTGKVKSDMALFPYVQYQITIGVYSLQKAAGAAWGWLQAARVGCARGIASCRQPHCRCCSWPLPRLNPTPPDPAVQWGCARRPP